jgi:hypothetical protein
MRFLFLAFMSTLTIWGCAPKEPKFHYEQKVIIAKGFYQSCVGSVVGVKSRTYTDDPFVYDLTVFCGTSNAPLQLYIDEYELEAMSK